MLTKINENLYIDLSDIYLVDYEPNQQEILIYIKNHPKYAIVIKSISDKVTFQVKLDQYLARIKFNETNTYYTENESETGEDIVELPVRNRES